MSDVKTITNIFMRLLPPEMSDTQRAAHRHIALAVAGTMQIMLAKQRHDILNEIRKTKGSSAPPSGAQS